MEENKMNENKVRLYVSDLIKLFFKKLKVMIIAAVIFGILGGCLGVFLAVKNAQYTGTLDIYVSHLDDTDVLLNDLRSGRFAEKLLLEKNGLPPKAECNSKDYNAALDALSAYAKAREDRLLKDIELSEFHMIDIENTYKRLEAEYKEAFDLLVVYKTADGEAVNNEEHLKMTAICEQNLLSIQEKKDAYYKEHYVPAQEAKVKLQSELAVLKDKVNSARREADEAVEKVLEAWRKTPGVANKVKKIMASTEYNYYEAEAAKGAAAATDAKSVAKKYIRVSIAVPANDQEFAKMLLENHKTRLCDYVEEKIETISGEPKVECIITNPTASLAKTPNSYNVTEAIKYAAVAMIAAAVLVYIFFLGKMLFKVELHNTKE